MIRTLWLALIGLASLGVLVGIKMGAAPLAGADMSRVEATTAEQVTSTKADKLEVSNIGPTLDKTVVTPITIMPPKTKSEQTEATTKIVSQHWHDPLAPKWVSRLILCFVAWRAGGSYRIASIRQMRSLFWAEVSTFACPCRKPYLAWQWIENRAMLLCNEGPLQAYWLDGCRSGREQRSRQRSWYSGSK